MINLSNIKKENNLISADVETVETHPSYFNIVVDLEEEKVVKNTNTAFNTDVIMALGRFVKLSEEYGDNLPKTATSVWY